MLDDLMELTSRRLPERVSDVEAQVSWLLGIRGDFAAALEVAQRAMRRIPSAQLSRRLFAYVAQNLSYLLIELGRWDEAAGFLAEARSIYSLGWTAFELDVEAVRFACYRGDLGEAEETLRLLWGRVPANESDALSFVSRGAYARVASANLAAHQGRPEGVRHQLAPLWAVPDLEEESDRMWRPLLVAARAEADLARRVSTALQDWSFPALEL